MSPAWNDRYKGKKIRLHSLFTKTDLSHWREKKSSVDQLDIVDISFSSASSAEHQSSSQLTLDMLFVIFH